MADVLEKDMDKMQGNLHFLNVLREAMLFDQIEKQDAIFALKAAQALGSITQDLDVASIVNSTANSIAASQILAEQYTTNQFRNPVKVLEAWMGEGFSPLTGVLSTMSGLDDVGNLWTLLLNLRISLETFHENTNLVADLANTVLLWIPIWIKAKTTARIVVQVSVGLELGARWARKQQELHDEIEETISMKKRYWKSFAYQTMYHLFRAPAVWMQEVSGRLVLSSTSLGATVALFTIGTDIVSFLTSNEYTVSLQFLVGLGVFTTAISPLTSTIGPLTSIMSSFIKNPKKGFQMFFRFLGIVRGFTWTIAMDAIRKPWRQLYDSTKFFEEIQQQRELSRKYQIYSIRSLGWNSVKQGFMGRQATMIFYAAFIYVLKNFTLYSASRLIPMAKSWLGSYAEVFPVPDIGYTDPRRSMLHNLIQGEAYVRRETAVETTKKLIAKAFEEASVPNEEAIVEGIANVEQAKLLLQQMIKALEPENEGLLAQTEWLRLAFSEQLATLLNHPYTEMI